MAKVKLNVENIKNLSVGEIKYKELISMLDMENKRAGDPRNAQLRELRQYMDIQHIKAGRFMINEIYDSPVAKIDNRKLALGGNNKNYPAFKVRDDHRNCKGVYSITLGDKIYIGSTIVGFRKRFLQHLYKNSNVPTTRSMLKNGATFQIIKIMDGFSESEIRNEEDFYIREARKDKTLNVVNRKDVKHRVAKTKKIKVLKNEYEDIVKILNEYGYSVL